MHPIFGRLGLRAILSDLDVTHPISLFTYVHLLRRAPLRHVNGRLVSFDPTGLLHYMRESLPVKDFCSDAINNELFLETLCWLPEEALTRHDKLGMAFSMEARFPWLLRGVSEYAFSLPSKEKIASQGKNGCRESLTRMSCRISSSINVRRGGEHRPTSGTAPLALPKS